MKKGVIGMAASSSLFVLGRLGPEGDALRARDFADQLLRPLGDGDGHDFRDARLLLSALCLHLSSRTGPDATVGDLLAWIEVGRDGLEAFAELRDSPMQLLVFAHAELLSLAPETRSVALDLCLAAVGLASSKIP